MSGSQIRRTAIGWMLRRIYDGWAIALFAQIAANVEKFAASDVALPHGKGAKRSEKGDFLECSKHVLSICRQVQ